MANWPPDHGYLGQFPVDISQTEFKDFGPFEWAMYFLERYGQIDGEHHKAWVLDQIARIYNGTPVIVVEARWERADPEFRVWLDEPTPKYLEWLENMYGDVVDEETGEREYGYDEGIAP